MNFKSQKKYSKKTKTLMVYETDSEEMSNHSLRDDIHTARRVNQIKHANDFCSECIKEYCLRHRALRSANEIKHSCRCTYCEEEEEDDEDYSCHPHLRFEEIVVILFKFLFNIIIGIFVIFKNFITTDWLNYGTVESGSLVERNRGCDACNYHTKNTNNTLSKPKTSVKSQTISQKTGCCSTKIPLVNLDSECLKLLSTLDSPKNEVIHQASQTKYQGLPKLDENWGAQFSPRDYRITMKNQFSQTTNQLRCERRTSPVTILELESSETSVSEEYPKRTSGRKLETKKRRFSQQSSLEYKDQYTQTNKESKGCQSSVKCDFIKKSVTIQAFESEESGNDTSIKHVRETRTSLRSIEESHKVLVSLQESESPSVTTLTINDKKLETVPGTASVYKNLQESVDLLSSTIYMFVQSNQVQPPPSSNPAEVEQFLSDENNIQNK